MKNTDKKIFISGAISSKMDTYKKDFADFEESLRKMGFKNIMSPAVLPSEGFSYENYMAITDAMLKSCNVVVFMDGWQESKGCKIEYEGAISCGMILLEGLEEAKMFAEGLYETD